VRINWIGLTGTLTLDDVLLVHGTPDDDLTYFLETVTESGCREATPAEVRRRAGDTASKLILCGHTHIQRAMKLVEGRLIVNPGSVGLQAYEDHHPFPHRIEMGSPHARYALVTPTGSEWKVEFRTVEYDRDEAARTAKANGRLDWFVALRSGYC
jgi:predicted phosphodiesterase